MSDVSLLRAKIHQSRQICGKKKQQTYGTMLEMFGCVLMNELKLPHPYQLDEVQLCEIDTRTKLFALGATGTQVSISGEKYLYRIFKKGHLPSNVRFKWSTFNNRSDLLWKFLRGKSKEGTKWVKLQDYALNNYPNPVRCWFGCTWWTTCPLDEDVILGAYKIGMFSEWVTDEVYVMRVLVEEVNSLGVAHVPTVIDAFMQPVFLPTDEPPAPGCGTTINLYDHQNLTNGVGEFVVRPFEVKLIEIKAISVKHDQKRLHPAVSVNDPDVLQSLLSYYDSL